MNSFEQIQFKLYSFITIICVFIIFMIYHIQRYLMIPLADYTVFEYGLVLLSVCFIILCLVQSKHLLTEYDDMSRSGYCATETENELLKELRCLNTSELTQLVVNLFRTYGFQQEFREMPSHGQFSEILLTYQNKKILLCCKAYGNGRLIAQSYLDRLYLKQQKHQADEAYFISLSDFSDECAIFADDHNLILFNSNDVATLLQPILH